MADPSIKGSLVAPMVDDLRALLEAGRVSEADLEGCLGAETLRVFESKINPSDWLALTIYEDLAAALREFEGRGNLQYMHQRGCRAGQRLAEAGLYRQLTFFERRRTQTDSMDAYLSDLRLILSLQSVLISTGCWEARVDPDHADRAMVVVGEADALPDPLVQAIAGLFEGISERAHKSGCGWRAERLDRSTLHFRMDRGIDQLD
jgi:hypothetical protein